jgi:hypothetical protein
LDITRDYIIDDNAFQAELALLVENSVNIHGDEVPGGLLRLEINENPRSKVRACAKNGKLWDIGAVSMAGQAFYPGKDNRAHQKDFEAYFCAGDNSAPFKSDRSRAEMEGRSLE